MHSILSRSTLSRLTSLLKKEKPCQQRSQRMKIELFMTVCVGLYSHQHTLKVSNTSTTLAQQDALSSVMFDIQNDLTFVKLNIFRFLRVMKNRKPNITYH